MNIFTTRSKSEKLRKAFFSAFLIVSLVLSQAALPLTLAYAQQNESSEEQALSNQNQNDHEEQARGNDHDHDEDDDNDNKVNICHATSSQNNPWSAQQVSSSALATHLGHGDFQYNGPLKQNGKPANDGDDWCKNHVPVPVNPTATISATKVVCDAEQYLPNWGAGGSNITATTAADFVSISNGKCHLAPWTFEYGLNGEGGVSIPDNNQAVGGAGWTPFITTATVPAGASYWVREQTQPGYVPFSGATSDFDNAVSKNSAEIYCDEDVLNYDNYDYTRVTQPNTTYHCVGFNALAPSPLQCNPQVNLIENGDFEAPALSNGTWDIIPTSNTLLKWLVAFISPSAGRRGLEIQNHVAGDPALGAQHAELDGDNPVTIWQDIPTIAGKEYTLSFKYSPRPGVSQADNAIQPKVNGSVLGAAVSADGSANSNTVWTTITRTFIGTGSPMKVELADAGNDTSLGGYVDDVKLNCGEPLPPPPQCNANASSTVVSDATTLVNGNPAAVLSFIHSGWTAVIPGATWIWATNPVESPTNDADLTKVFTKTFTIVGTPTGGSLEIAADNNYSVKVNGTTVSVAFDQNNFQSGTQDTYNVLPLLVSGLNTLEFTVTNWEIGQNADPAANPAGLLYKLSLTNNECVTPPVGPSTSTVTMCKENADVPDSDGFYPMPGWTLTLKGASVGSVDVLPTGADFKIAGVPAGDYILNAIGKYTYRGTPGAEFSDAAYSQRDPGDAVYQTAALNPIQSPFLPWVRENDFPTPNTGWLGVMYNNAPTNWGSIFNTSHDYVLGTSTASLGDMSFKILDDQYGDNSGKITVNAAHGYVGVTQGFDTGTPGPGCVSFSNVPYGTYTAGEIMQSGWENVSGLGSVVVDSPTEKFVILNRHIAPPAPTDGKVHIFKFINDEQATALSADSVAFPMKTATYGNAQFFLRPSGWDTGDAPYEASTSTMTAGATYTANEDLTTSPALVGASCDSQSRPAYELVGYSTGSTLEAAKTATKTLTAPILTINGDQYMIVWNHKCGSVLGASTLKVHLYKYLKDGNTIAQIPNDSSAPEFPMTATWQTANLNGGVSSSAPYVLGNYHGGTSLKYAADTAPMEAPASYTSSEVTSVESNFLPIGAQCVPGKYRLVGYKSSINSVATAEGMPTYNDAPVFPNLNTDAYVIVINEKCADLPPPPATGSIEITKYTCPANFVPNRTTNGVGGSVPEGCTLTAGTAFGYVHGDATDANGPYPELDATPTPGGITAGNGKLVIGPVLSAGRYLIKETDGTNLAGLYCQGDGDTNPNNNDNQELTFVPANGVTKCVAYNKTTVLAETASNHTTVVKAADLDAADVPAAYTNNSGKWFFYNDNTDHIDNNLGSFVTGPSVAPIGTGSAEMTNTATNSRINIATFAYSNVKLSDIKSLSFSAYSHAGVAGPTESPYLVFNVSFDGTGAYQKRLVYVPANNGAVPQDSWNTYDTINSGAGQWVYSGTTWPTTLDAGTTPKTWNQILALYPNAKVLPVGGLMGVRVGEPGPTNYVGGVDKFVIGVKTGINTHTETYDFEPTPAQSCDAGSYTDLSNNSGAIRFETSQGYNTGSINGVNGWSATGAYDYGVVANTYGYASFDNQVFRISDGITSGSFGDWAFATPNANGAGEASATNGAFSRGILQNHFEAQFDIASTRPCAQQEGLHFSVSPDRGDGSRMSYLRFEDQADGTHVFFDDVSGITNATISFDETDIATLSRSIPHKIKFVMDFVDGPSNDIVKIYIDGALVKTGTSWENYYRYDSESVSEQSPRIVKTLIFQARGTAHPANTGKGYLVDNLTLGSSIPAPLCSDGIDNDDDGLIDMNDSGCSGPSDNDETTPVQTFSRGGGGGGGGMILPAAPKGSVLGASTQCGLYLDDFLKMGKKNNKDEVKKLQTFLNDYLKLSPKISVNGIFGLQTHKAVIKFQEQEAGYILQPWVGITLKNSFKGTGWVYKTTVTRINNIMCPELNLQNPPLTID